MVFQYTTIRAISINIYVKSTDFFCIVIIYNCYYSWLDLPTRDTIQNLDLLLKRKTSTKNYIGFVLSPCRSSRRRRTVHMCLPSLRLEYGLFSAQPQTFQICIFIIKSTASDLIARRAVSTINRRGAYRLDHKIARKHYARAGYTARYSFLWSLVPCRSKRGIL